MVVSKSATVVSAVKTFVRALAASGCSISVMPRASGKNISALETSVFTLETVAATTGRLPP
jgi:hypothetical protein